MLRDTPQPQAIIATIEDSNANKDQNLENCFPEIISN